MDAKFFSGLFEGDSVDGVKLGMGLTGGDFWSRVAGCRNLYRCEEPYDMDFEELVCVSDIETGRMFSSLSHLAGAAYVYALREANGCGDEQHGPGAVVRAAFDSEGELVVARPNEAFCVDAGRVGSAVRLLWYYCPLGQGEACSEFRVYGDGGSGEIDYDEAIGTVDCAGVGLYRFVSDSLSDGVYRFCVRCVSKAGVESGGGTVAVAIGGGELVGVDSVTVGVV